MSELDFQVHGLTEDQVRRWRPGKPLGRIPGIAILAVVILVAAIHARNPRLPVVGVVPGVDFGEHPIKEAGPFEAITITNRGSAALMITTVAVEGDQEEAFEISSNRCAEATVEPGKECSVDVRFTPQHLGNQRARLVITDNAGDSPQLVSLSGEGLEPAEPRTEIAPRPLNFGSIKLGAPGETRQAMVRNVGTAPLLVTDVTITGAADFNILGQDCTRQPIPAGHDCSIELRFAPRSPGLRQGQLVISDNAVDTPQIVELSGLGVAQAPPTTPTAPRVRVTPNPTDFGRQSLRTTPQVRRVIVDNVGTAPLVITGIRLSESGGPDFSVLSQDCTRQPVAANGSCFIELQFVPRSSGSHQAQLLISDNAADSPQVVNLSGTSVSPVPPTPPAVPRARITPNPVDFRVQPLRSLARRRVTVENLGPTPLVVSSVTVGGTPEFGVLGQDCTQQPVPAHQNCSIELRFAPRSSGSREARLVISDNASDSPQVITLSGTGVAPTPAPTDAVPRVRVTPNPTDFGRQQLRATPQVRQIIVDNLGTAPLIVTGMALSGSAGPDFVIGAQDCTRQPVSVHQNCTVEVRFTPRSSGFRQAQLLISDNAANSPQAVNLNGVAVPPGGVPPTPSGNLGASGPTRPLAVTGWCCVGQNLTPSSLQACQLKQGAFYGDERTARARCQRVN